ncbi:MAG: GTP-binding protein [Thermoleophilia bacterium]
MQVDIVAGYLGAGKTTTIRHLIETDPEPQRLVVLVNEFGELGIDGLLVAGAEDVVELSSGCICCTLRLDFRTQIKEIAERLHPRRLLIEPTGVATIGQVLKALDDPSIAPFIAGLRVFALVDATSFNERLRESPRFFTSQVQSADVIALNKIDLVEPARVEVLKAAVESLAPDAWVVPTERGRLPEEASLPPYHPPRDAPESEVLSDLGSFSFRLSSQVPAETLRALFGRLRDGTLGKVERAKALAETEEGWLRLDLAGSTFEEQPSGPVPEGRLVVIGRELDSQGLREAVGQMTTSLTQDRK